MVSVVRLFQLATVIDEGTILGQVRISVTITVEVRLFLDEQRNSVHHLLVVLPGIRPSHFKGAKQSSVLPSIKMPCYSYGLDHIRVSTQPPQHHYHEHSCVQIRLVILEAYLLNHY